MFDEKYFWVVQDETSPILPGLWNPITNEEGGHTYVVTRISGSLLALKANELSADYAFKIDSQLS